MENNLVKIKEVALTEKIINKILQAEQEIENIKKQLNNQIILMLDSFAEGSGIEKDQIWKLSPENKSLVIFKQDFNDDVNKEEVSSAEIID